MSTGTGLRGGGGNSPRIRARVKKFWQNILGKFSFMLKDAEITFPLFSIAILVVSEEKLGQTKNLPLPAINENSRKSKILPPKLKVPLRLRLPVKKCYCLTHVVSLLCSDLHTQCHLKSVSSASINSTLFSLHALRKRLVLAC